MMKRIIVFLIALIFAFVLFGCNDSSKVTDDLNGKESFLTENKETAVTKSIETQSVTESEKSYETEAETEPVTKRESVLVELDGYSAMTNPDVFVPDSSDSAAGSDFAGSGEDLINAIKSKYIKYTPAYYLVTDGEKHKIGVNKVKSLDSIYAEYEQDKSTMTLNVTITEASAVIVPEYISYTAKEGAFISVTFKTNIPAIFTVSIGQKGSAEGIICHDNILPLGKNGDYTGIGQMTVPYVGAGDYYINYSIGDKYIMSSDLRIEKNDNDSEYHLLMSGAWHLIENDEYRLNLVDLFYSVYPRLYARWANGTEPKTITFVADRAYDGVAYCAGTKVVVSTDYAKGNPYDLGFFAHEITHSVQQYSDFSTEWWTENMANYGGSRYFHWADSSHVQVFYPNDTGLQNWNYEPYGNNKWFFAYMDYKYPTTKEGGLGLIDTINQGIKNHTITSDGGVKGVNDPNTSFNKAVKVGTKGEFDTFEALRLYYVQELKKYIDTDGKEGWSFVGFKDYKDNYLTENLKDLPDPDYPVFVGLVHGDKTNPILSGTVAEGDNLAKGAKVVRASGKLKGSNAPEMAFDGDLSTSWATSKSTISDNTAALYEMDQILVFDLGENKRFNTYTLVFVNETARAADAVKEWEIMISNDGKTWMSVDYQKGNTSRSVSVDIGSNEARYIKINIIKSSSSGTARLYECMIFDR